METSHSCEDRHSHDMRHFLPLLAVPLAIGVLRGMARRRHMFMHMHAAMHGGEGMHAREGMPGREGWQNGVPPFFAEWHRRAHETPQPEVKES